MNMPVIAFLCWLVAAVPTWIFYALAKRDVAEARRVRDEIRRCKPEFSEAAPAAGYEAAIAMAIMEKEGASLQ